MEASASKPSHGRRGRGLAAVIVAAIMVAACGSPKLEGVVNFPGSGGANVAPVNKKDITVAFEPFTGIPGNIADTLAQYIAEQARVRSITLVQRVGSPATYRVKGFLSAVSTDNAASVVYVFDVFDASGQRLHRITGSQQASVSVGDPWSGVRDPSLNLIAVDVMAELNAWLAGGGK